jgi:crotonobetainyl-CoA:carnitine CoA-transferase CaiB-like acyl-CoA transferase
MLPLDGIRVLDLTRLLPGAVATQYLRDFGAEIIKIEPPVTGDYSRHFLSVAGETPIFTATNRGKKSVVLDLKNPHARDVMIRLAENADVLIEGFRPGVMTRLGLDYDDLKSRNPRLIGVAITGYGQSGPYRDMAGHDLNYLSLAGVLDLIGPKDGSPVIPGVQIADLSGGAMQAVIGVLLALAARERTGEGQFVDVSMMNGSAALLVFPLAYLHATGSQSERGNDVLSGRYACYNVYRCSDDRWISVGALESRFWGTLCRELGRPELIKDQFAEEPRQSEVKAAIVDAFRQRAAEEWFALLGKKDCCVTPVRTLDEAARDPHFEACPIGIIPKMTTTPAKLDGVSPQLGEHTIEALSSVGYTQQQIDELKHRGAIR